jgi:hypothetical protein
MYNPEDDQQSVVDYVTQRIAKNQDIPRGVWLMLESFYEQGSDHVDEPHSFDELAKLDREERRTLIAQLEEAGRAPRFNAVAYRRTMQ